MVVISARLGGRTRTDTAVGEQEHQRRGRDHSVRKACRPASWRTPPGIDLGSEQLARH
jgi:hypothetical protein